MSDKDLICLCISVTRGEIVEAIDKGAHTFEALKEVLYCGTGCGTCQGRVQKILDEKLLKTGAVVAASDEKKVG